MNACVAVFLCVCLACFVAWAFLLIYSRAAYALSALFVKQWSRLSYVVVLYYYEWQGACFPFVCASHIVQQGALLVKELLFLLYFRRSPGPMYAYHGMRHIW